MKTIEINELIVYGFKRKHGREPSDKEMAEIKRKLVEMITDMLREDEESA